MAKSSVFIDGKQAGQTMKAIRLEVAGLKRELNLLPVGSEKYEKTLEKLKPKAKILADHNRNVRGINNSYKEANTSMGSMLKRFAPMAIGFAAVGSVVGTVANAFSSWYENNVKMEKSLSTLQSITGATKQEVQFYREEAIRMGRDSSKSASEVVDAMMLIGSAKPELLKNKEALAEVTEQTIVLAEAAQINMETAAKAITGTLNQFDEGAESADRFINAFAAGSKEGAANIQNISDTMDKAGAVANGYNVTVEETIGLTETLAEKNLKGAEAGTQMKNVLLIMQGLEGLPPEAVQRTEAMGVNIAKVMDTTIPFNERLKEMSKITGDVVTMQKVFGKENITAAKAILENTDKVEAYTKAVSDTNVAYEQQAINNDNLEGDLKSLSSAWEGLTLTLGGGDIFRPVVQAGTDFLNWTTDTITALKEWDTNQMEVSFLKMQRLFSGLIPGMTQMIDQAIRVREITSQVVDAMQDEADAAVVLTSSIAKNNEKLKDANTTEEEAAAIRSENEEIIAALNEKYPELTENIEWHTASSEEMNELQKEINETLLEQALATAKAAEAERLLNDIVNKTIQLQYQRKSEEDMGGYMKFMASQVSMFTRQADDIEEEIKQAKKDYENIDDTFENVEATFKDLDIDFGTAYKVNADIAQDALDDLKVKHKELAKATSEESKRAIMAEITALEKVAERGNENQQQMLDNILNGIKETDQAQEQAQRKAERAAAAASKKQQQRMKKMRADLEKIIESARELQESFDYTQRLEAFEEGLQKELFALEHSINEKYAKEIEAAEELANEKGKIGEQAAEELNALLILKDQELNYEREKIHEKFTQEEKDRKYEDAKQANLLYLRQQESLEDSIISLKVSKAQIAADQLDKMDADQRAKVLENLEEALKEQAEHEMKIKLQNLMEQEAEFEITRSEFDNRKKELEEQLAKELIDIHENTAERLQEIDVARIENTIGTITNVMAQLSTLADAQAQHRINKVDEEEQNEIESLQRRLFLKEISEEEYQEKKRQIEMEADAERRVLERRQAERQKAMALFEIALNTAVAVSKVAGFPPLIALALLTGAAQAAAVAARPLPQLYMGGFTDVVGADDGKQYRAKNIGRPKAGMVQGGPSVALINEQGPEYFVPNALLRNQSVINHVAAIEAIRTRQFAQGGFTANVGGGSSGDLEAMIQANIELNRELLRILPNLSVRFNDGNIEDLEKRMEELKKLVA